MDDELRWRLYMLSRLGGWAMRALSLCLFPWKDETPRIRQTRKIGLAMNVLQLGFLLRQIARHRKEL